MSRMASEGARDAEEVEDMETEMSPERERETPSPQNPSPKRGSDAEADEHFPQLKIRNGQEGVEEELEMVVSDHDPTCSEGVIKCNISDISSITGKLLSPPIYIRDMPWRLLIMPRESVTNEGKVKSLGIFVQCNPKNVESASWNVAGRANIKLISQTDSSHDYCREIYHCFCARENDWGFSNFMVWKELMDDSKGYVKDDSITVHAEVVADAPHGINWDSRKYTGFVGLKNQGATCYMNSLLQTLYCTNKLRQAVYKMPTENDDPIKSVPLALQRLFNDLQHSDRPVGTRKLTKSFGWDTMDIFMQHDVQELSRVLLDNIECKMKETVVELHGSFDNCMRKWTPEKLNYNFKKRASEKCGLVKKLSRQTFECLIKDRSGFNFVGTITALFEGKMESYIRCRHVDYESTRTETFFDIQLNIKDKKDVHESFKDYVNVETLSGENKYAAGEHGLQEARKGMIFVSLPPVLHLHLMRFQYDPLTDTNIKINDRYAFPEQLKLDEFLKASESTPANYLLLAVLVHSGDNYGGHYVVYVNPHGKGKWLKFDDDVVSTCSCKEAIENNFGGNDDTLGIRNCTNAYMLVYVRHNSIDDVLQEVTDADICKSLTARFADEKEMEMVRRKERSESHLYMLVEVYLEDDFQSHQTSDLIDFEEAKAKSFKIMKSQSLAQFHGHLAGYLGYPKNHIRLWPFEKRNNLTCRPSFVDRDDAKTVFQHADCKQPWRLFVETLPPDSKLDGFEHYDEQSKFPLWYCIDGHVRGVEIISADGQVLLFFKYYDPTRSIMTYMGHHVEAIVNKLVDIFPLLREWAGLPDNCPLILFEEVKPNLIDKVDPDLQLCNVDDIRDGDIICYQRADIHFQRHVIPTVAEYFKELCNRCDVSFFDKNSNSDPGFTLNLSNRMTYDEMAKAVAQHLDTDHRKLQFFRPQLTQRNFSQLPIRSTIEGCLRELVKSGNKPTLETPPMLCYQVLPIPVDEFENKKCFHCVYVNLKLKEEKELTLYVEKNSTVQELIEEAMKEITFNDGGTKCLRLLEVMTNRIVEIFTPEKPVSELFTQRIYRVEEVRPEEMHLETNELLIPVAHFQKALHNLFGIPFLLKISDGECLSKVTARIKSLLEVTESEFDKWKFAILEAVAPAHYFSDSEVITLAHFLLDPKKGILFPRMGMPLLGIDHVNKAPKRTRYILERSIKIHN